MGWFNKEGDPLVDKALYIAKKENIEIYEYSKDRTYFLLIDDNMFEVNKFTDYYEVCIFNYTKNNWGVISKNGPKKSDYNISEYSWACVLKAYNKQELKKKIVKRDKDMELLDDVARSSKKYNL